MLGIVKGGIQNKGGNRIQPLCKLLRPLNVLGAHSQSTADRRKGAVKGGPGCQNHSANKEQMNRIGREPGKETSEGEVRQSSAKSKATRPRVDWPCSASRRRQPVTLFSG